MIPRLQKAFELLKSWTSTDKIPAAGLAIGRKGKMIEPLLVGRQKPDKDSPPIRKDALFLIASITKPVVVRATMMLVERGHLAARRSRQSIHSQVRRRRTRSDSNSSSDDPYQRPAGHAGHQRGFAKSTSTLFGIHRSHLQGTFTVPGRHESKLPEHGYCTIGRDCASGFGQDDRRVSSQGSV